MDIAFLITCHNRADLLERCLSNLQQFHKGHLFLVADNCQDDSVQRCQRVWKQPLTILQTPSDAFWAKSMALGETAAKKHQPDFIFWINEDTMLTHPIPIHPDHITAGAISNEQGNPYRGGVTRQKNRPLNFQLCPFPNDPDTFHGNCVAIPKQFYNELAIHPYQHAFADFDYGLRAKERCFPIQTTPPIGWTPTRTRQWRTIKNPILRWKACFHPTGLPLQDWWTFSRRNQGPVLHWLRAYRFLLRPKLDLSNPNQENKKTP